MENNTRGVLTAKTLQEFRKAFDADPKNLLALNVCTKNDPVEMCLRRSTLETTNHIFTHKVDSEIKPVTNQKNSGRCWLFACLNVLRIPFVKQHQIEEFEFSQNYLFFWDKLERCNYFLHTIANVFQKGESVDGRLVSFLLQDPVPDGGQWDMIVNLISRHGLVPKKCFPETYCCETSCRLNCILKSKMREYARDLHSMVEKGCSEDQLEDKIKTIMEEVYRIVAICLGIPPEVFTWEYYNKNKAYCSVGPITPLKFYEDYVKPFCNVENKICLVNDPRPENPYKRAYTVDCLGNMVGGRRTIYNNQSVDVLLKLSADSIKNNEPVWFGCEVGKRFAGKPGIQDLDAHDYKLLFGVDVNRGLNKAERLLYGDSGMNHAMVFTAVSIDENGQPTKWRIENSWGEDRGEKGYLVMTTEWFKEFGFEVVVDKQYVPQEVLDVMKQEPKVLPAWDPMGALAL